MLNETLEYMRNLFGRARRGLCRFFVCYSCNLTVCGRNFLLPRVIIDDNCPICEAIFWYKGPPKYEELEKCDCYIQSCDNCGNILCSCTIESRFGECPWCELYDRWVVIPPELFSEQGE